MKTLDQEKRELKEIVLDQVKWFSLILGAISYIDTLIIQLSQGKILMVIVFGILCVGALSMLFIKVIPTNIRVSIIVVILYLVGLLSILNKGIAGSGPLWLLAFSCVTAALLGKRLGMTAVALSFATISTYVLYIQLTGNYAMIPDPNSLSEGIERTFDMSLLAFVCAIPTASLLGKLDTLLELEKKQSREMVATNQKLESANEDLNAFAHTLSHDLRAPIRNIQGFTQMVRDTIEDDQPELTTKYLDRIDASSKKADVLINEIMRLSQISSSQLHYEEVDLTTIVHNAVAAMRAHTPFKKVSTRVEENCRVLGDRELLTIAIDNLVSNAFKYSVDGDDPLVEFGINMDGDDLVFFIKDNGVGFDMSNSRKLFAPFERLHSNDQYAGFGVGLATVRKIIEMHDGIIWAESVVGKGSTFYFALGL